MKQIDLRRYGRRPVLKRGSPMKHRSVLTGRLPLPATARRAVVGPGEAVIAGVASLLAPGDSTR